jgi:hypothetical protein
MASHIPQFISRRVMRDVFGALLVTVLFFLATGDVCAQALRQAPGSRIAMEIDKTFVASGQFTGFLDEDSGASIVIVEMPSHAYDEVKKLADQPAALANKGISSVQKALLDRPGEYVYLTGWQRTPSGDYAKFLLIMRENGVTAVITANVPENALQQQMITRQQIEHALITATVRTEQTQTSAQFSFGYLGPFKEIAGFIGSSRAYSLSGRSPDRSSTLDAPEPLLVVAPSLDRSVVTDLKDMALNSFNTLGGFKEHRLISAYDVVAGRMKGYAITGEARDINTGTKSSVYVAIFAGQMGGHFIIVGSCPAEDVKVYMPEFEKIVASFKPLRPN